MASPCIICDNSIDNTLYTIKELQLGLGESFTYQLCAACGSMQLESFPVEFDKYYPNNNYYSFNFDVTKKAGVNPFKKIQSSYLLFNKNPVVGFLTTIGYNPPEFYEWLKNTKANYSDAILDIGSGNGSLLLKMYETGFTNLTGIDPFIDTEIDYGKVKVYKKDIFEMKGAYDIIMMHHSLEHMERPLEVLQKARMLLNENKYLLIRLPVMGHYGWNKYKEYWCGIDAPRHIFIPSEKGIKKLIKDAGFEIEKIVYDSSDYLIWSSEQYKKGIPLHGENSRMINKDNDTFTDEEIKKFRTVISDANKKNFGDTAAFYLKRT